jgi:hypothetical protein
MYMWGADRTCNVMCCALVQVGPDLVVPGLNATADSFYSSQVSKGMQSVAKPHPRLGILDCCTC